MKLDTVKLKKLLIRALPYILIVWSVPIWEKPGE